MSPRRKINQGRWTIVVPHETCELCGKEHPKFVMWGHLWAKVMHKTRTRMFKDLCEDCVGKRLGRPLTLDDLKSGVPANFLYIQYYIQRNPSRLGMGGDEDGNGDKAA